MYIHMYFVIVNAGNETKNRPHTSTMATCKNVRYMAVRKYSADICELLAGTSNPSWLGDRLEQECFISSLDKRAIVCSTSLPKYDKFSRLLDTVMTQVKLDTSGSKFQTFIRILEEQKPLSVAVILLKGSALTYM